MKIVSRVLMLMALAMMPILTSATQSTPAAKSGEPSPFGNGIGSTATYLDQRGNPILSFTVTGIERGWDGYDRYSEPQAGMEYVVVRVTVTNETARPFILEPYKFSLVDSLGMTVDRAWVSAGPEFLTDDTTIDGGESIEAGLIFEIFSDVNPLLLMFEPDYDFHVVVYLGE